MLLLFLRYTLHLVKCTELAAQVNQYLYVQVFMLVLSIGIEI